MSMCEVTGQGATITPASAPGGPAGWVKKLHYPAMWARGITGRARAAVIDTGIDLAHPYLGSAVTAVRNFTSADGGNTDLVTDRHGHGSHVAGIIRQGAPGVELLIAKALGDDGKGSLSQLAGAVDWARESGARVICASWGTKGEPPDDTLHAAVRRAVDAGIVFVAAAGNEGRARLEIDTVIWPARYQEPLAVAATWQVIGNSPLSMAAPYSSAGPEIDVCAPGTDILSCAPGGGWVYLSGTSMATPVVVAMACLVIDWWTQAHGTPPTGAQVEAIVMFLTRDLLPVGRDVLSGVGEVDLIPLAEYRNAKVTDGAGVLKVQETMSLTESFVPLNVPARIEEGRFFAEFRGLSTALGANHIGWDPDTRTGSAKIDVIPMPNAPPKGSG